MEEIFGSMIFEYIGAGTKWLFYFLLHKIKGKPTISFKRIYDGKRGISEYDSIMLGWSNIWLGVFMVVVFAILLVIIDFD